MLGTEAEAVAALAALALSADPAGPPAIIFSLICSLVRRLVQGPQPCWLRSEMCRRPRAGLKVVIDSPVKGTHSALVETPD